MIEFTIILDDSELHFEPATSQPDLALVLPPTARIGQDKADRDVVHLAPIPVHCFFNAITFSHWLAAEHGLSENDAFGVYVIHDMFKALLRLIPRNDGGRQWRHLFFDPLHDQLAKSSLFDNFETSFKVASHHHDRGRIAWREAVAHERDLLVGVEGRGKHWEWDWPIIGLNVRLQSSLPNALSIAYVKRLFVESYVEAIRSEYPDVFARFDAVSYEYEFLDPESVTADTTSDIQALCRKSAVYLDGRHLVVSTPVGAYGPYWTPDQTTSISVPFRLLLTLREDSVSILFPVPTLRDASGEPADNPAFVKRVSDAFRRRVRDLLSTAKVSKSKRARWDQRVDALISQSDQVFHVLHTTSLDDADNGRRADAALATDTCSMCGSRVPPSFICSPVRDLGFSKSNYTDWHLGDADHACVLCAISHFKTPEVLKPAKKLIFQRKLVYLAASTPSATQSDTDRATLPFFEARGFTPQLEIRSLESLVTLNVIAALYLHDVVQRSVHYRDGARDLWLEQTFPIGPFAFAGEVATAKNKVEMPDFLNELFDTLNRPITLLDPLLPIQVEVPFHSFICLWGVSKGRHFQFKYKPLIVSNETGTLPVIWEGYHFVDRQILDDIQTLREFVETFRHPKVTHCEKLTALASSPEEFVDMLVERGKFNYETILSRLAELSGTSDARGYLKRMRQLVIQTPLITDIWRRTNDRRCL